MWNASENWRRRYTSCSINTTMVRGHTSHAHSTAKEVTLPAWLCHVILVAGGLSTDLFRDRLRALGVEETPEASRLLRHPPVTFSALFKALLVEPTGVSGAVPAGAGSQRIGELFARERAPQSRPSVHTTPQSSQDVITWRSKWHCAVQPSFLLASLAYSCRLLCLVCPSPTPLPLPPFPYPPSPPPTPPTLPL